MDKYNSWKRTDETEIDLADLLRSLCIRWKKIAACALASSIIFAGYGWMKNREGLDKDLTDLAQEAVLTVKEQQAVADAVQLDQETGKLEEYLENSILMQLDAYHKTEYIMFYSIDRADRQELASITESYLNFVMNGGAADALKKSGSRWQMDKSYLAEVITAYQKTYSSPYQIAVDDQTDSSLETDALFYVEITGGDEEEAERLALDVQTVLEQYSANVRKAAGSHRLKLVSSEKSVTADMGLLTQQHDKRTLLSSNKTNLASMTDAFSTEQMAVFHTAASQKEMPGEEVSEEKSGYGFGAAARYLLFGAVAGIFVYCGVFSFRYMFLDTVKSAEEMKRRYTFPVFGGICLENRKVTGTWEDAYGNTEEQVLSRIRSACRKQKITHLYAASDFLLSESGKKCLERMAARLSGWGIVMEIAENVHTDTDLWDSLTEAGNVLLVCRMGMTTHRMIDDAMNFYSGNGIDVTGAAVFL